MRGESSRRDYGPPARVFGKKDGASFQVIILVSEVASRKEGSEFLLFPGTVQQSWVLFQTLLGSGLVYVLKQHIHYSLLLVPDGRMNLAKANLLIAL
jgi:hypothetical protein